MYVLEEYEIQQLKAFDSAGLPNLELLEHGDEPKHFFKAFGKLLFVVMFVPKYGKFPTWVSPVVLKYIFDDVLDVNGDALKTPVEILLRNEFLEDAYWERLKGYFDHIRDYVIISKFKNDLANDLVDNAWSLDTIRSVPPESQYLAAQTISHFIMSSYLWDSRNVFLECISEGFYSSFSKDFLNAYIENLSTDVVILTFGEVIKNAQELVRCFNLDVYLFSEPSYESMTAKALLTIADWFEEAENDESQPFGLRRFLIWLTGSDQFPPQEKIELQFYNDNRYPESSTCFYKLKLSAKKYTTLVDNGSLTFQTDAKALYEDFKFAMSIDFGEQGTEQEHFSFSNL